MNPTKDTTNMDTTQQTLASIVLDGLKVLKEASALQEELVGKKGWTEAAREAAAAARQVMNSHLDRAKADLEEHRGKMDEHEFPQGSVRGKDSPKELPSEMHATEGKLAGRVAELHEALSESHREAMQNTSGRESRGHEKLAIQHGNLGEIHREDESDANARAAGNVPAPKHTNWGQGTGRFTSAK